MKLPEDVDDLVALVEKHGAEAVAKRFRKPPIPSTILRTANESQPDEAMCVFLARYHLTPSSVLEGMVRRYTEFTTPVLVELAQNPRTPPTELGALLKHPDAEVLAAVACNPNLPARDMQTLLEDGDTQVVQALAGNPSLKLNAQARIAAHGKPASRLALTQNKSLHPDLWVALSSDPSPMVRYALAAASHAPDDLLPFWADSDREEIQLALLSRSSLKDKLVKSLLLSPHATVRQAAAERMKLGHVEMLRLCQVKNVEERVSMAAHPDLPAALQHHLAVDDAVEVREALARNTSLWPEVAEFFVTGEDEAACLALINNPSMPEALYVELAWQNKPNIIAALASNEQTPVEVMQYLVNDRVSAEAVFHLAACDAETPWMRGDLADALAGLHSPSLRRLAAGAEALSLEKRNLLKDDPSPRVKIAAYETTPTREAPDEVNEAQDAAIIACLERLNELLAGKEPDELTA